MFIFDDKKKSFAECVSIFESHSSECCVCVCVRSLWAPCFSRVCVWEPLVLWDRPTAWEWRAGIIWTPCCSSNICLPVPSNRGEELGSCDESACSVIFSGDPGGEGLEQKPTPPHPHPALKPSCCIHPSPSSPQPSGFDILDPCVDE